jgi:hypothetical protein
MPSRGQRPDPAEARHGGAAGERAPPARPPTYYPSNAADTHVLHALTGDPFACKVGSADSLALFRVTDSTGRYDENGYRIRRRTRAANPEVGRTPNQLYYSTPQEYADHGGHPPPVAAVRAWTQRVTRLFPEGVFDEGAWGRYRAESPRRLRGRQARNTDPVD